MAKKTVTTDRTSEERELIRLVDKEIAQAEAGGRVIREDTARRIAAAVHRGLGGELERFAATGRLVHHHAARLELFYSLKDEPQFKVWGEALRGFINQNARGKQHKVRHKQAVRPRPRHTGGSGRSAAGPTGMLPQANPEPEDCDSCDPEGVLVYVCAGPDDDSQREGLALQVQHLACRRFTRRHLRKHLEASFADGRRGRKSGIRRLLAHLAICHNRRVVVQRLDRLPPDSPDAGQVREVGARVLSASEQNPRSRVRQAALGRDLAELAADQPKRSKHSERSRT